MASIETATRDIYGEITEYCDKEIGEFSRRVNRLIWKRRSKYFDKRVDNHRREKKWR